MWYNIMWSDWDQYITKCKSVAPVNDALFTMSHTALLNVASKYRIEGNFRGRKLSRISGSIRVSFLRENRRPHPHVSGGAKQSTKVSSLRKLLTSINSPKFFPSKVSLYTVQAFLSCELHYWMSQLSAPTHPFKPKVRYTSHWSSFTRLQ